MLVIRLIFMLPAKKVSQDVLTDFQHHGEIYADCTIDIRRDIVTATAAVSGLASVMFGFLTNLPVALA
jgi:xanthine/uracil/vitamin C permease (AzgA family)